MKRLWILIFCIFISSWLTSYCYSNEDQSTTMYQWRSHMAFTTIDEIVVLGEKVFALSSNALFSVNKTTEEIEYYTRLSGLSGAHIDHIAHNKVVDRMLITYNDGRIDFVDPDGDIYNISDLFVKQISVSKQVNDIYMHGELAYMAMSFGILVVDMRKMEIKDTYYIGENSSDVFLNTITINNDSIYATTKGNLYVADLSNNLSDYNFWTKLPLPSTGEVQRMVTHKGDVYLLLDKKLYQIAGDSYLLYDINSPLRTMCATETHLYLIVEDQHGAMELKDDKSFSRVIDYGYVIDVIEDNETLWLGTGFEGLVRYKNGIAETTYKPDGPSSNYSYRLRIFDDKLYMLPGGRWTSQYFRMGEIMIYENGIWENITYADLLPQTDSVPILDIMAVAQDPNDKEHYFVTSYGMGILEMQGKKVIKHHTPANSGLISAVGNMPDKYTRTDGIMYDDKGNLWILNTGGEKLGCAHVIASNGKWTSLQFLYNNTPIYLHTPGDMFMDRRDPSHKWIALPRSETGMILLQDNGTPHNPNDDKITYRTTWIDQNNNPIAPANIYTAVQDRNNTIWVGTSAGLFIIPPSVDFATSNKCERIIMPRNDGTNLGDYLLDSEQINAIAIDGANRIWIGTAASGLYLMDYTEDLNDADYTLETVAHFTTENSLLPSNNIISLAIQSSTGEVFIGTGSGLVSYVNEATEPKEDFSELYAYPNPVAANYYGYITIVGAMENTEVRIVDGSGNLVQKIKCIGGSATWDGTNTQGKRVASGVYTALCNTTDGNGHGIVKILVMN